MVLNSNFSNFNAFVIHDVQVLGLVSTKVQQAMNFLGESWVNMAKKIEILDLDGKTSHSFQLVSREIGRTRKSSLRQAKDSRSVHSTNHLTSFFDGSCPSFSVSFFNIFYLLFPFVLLESFGFYWDNLKVSHW